MSDQYVASNFPTIKAPSKCAVTVGRQRLPGETDISIALSSHYLVRPETAAIKNRPRIQPMIFCP
jgi:hypothetical protein